MEAITLILNAQKQKRSRVRLFGQQMPRTMGQTKSKHTIWFWDLF